MIFGTIPMTFAADTGLSASLKYISQSSLPTTITLTNTNNTFTPSNTYPMLVKGASTTNLNIGAQAAGSITATLPSGLENGTYEIRVGDPNGTNTNSGAKYFNVGNLVVADPTISTVSPQPNLALGYKDLTDITISGAYTSFTTGQSIVEILDNTNAVVMTPTIKSVSTVDDYNRNLVFSLGTGLSEGSYKVRVTTGTEAITTSGAVITVRGQASVVYNGMSSLSLNEGYSAQAITLTGTNTGFISGTTAVTAVDSAGSVTGTVSSLNVSSETSLSFTLTTGLTADTYTIKVKTDAEEAEIDFTVKAATVSLYDSTGNNLMTAIGQQGNSVTFRMIGQNTSFASGSSIFQLIKGTSVVSGGITSSTVNSSTTADVTINGNQTPGTDYKLRVTTGSQILDTQAFEIKSQATPSVTYSSIVYSNGKLSKGYPSFIVTVTGDSYSNFTSSSTATINAQTPTITVVDNSEITFAFPTGINEGSYTLSVDMDGSGATTFDKFDYALTVTKPVISSISPSSLVNTIGTATTISVLGLNTHYALADAIITVSILDGASQPVGSVSNIITNGNTGLKFDITPNTITSTGKFTINTKVIKGSYTEDLSLADGLTVASSGIGSVTPSSFYHDEIAGKSLTLVGIGTGFDSGDTYQIDNMAVADVTVTDTTHVVFGIPSSLTAGNHTIKIIDGASTYTSSFQIQGDRTVSVNSFTSPIDYTSEIVTVTAENIDFLASANNLPSITINGQHPTPSTTVSSDSITFTLPDNLAKGNYLVTFDWTAGAHNGLSLSDTLNITNRYSSLYFKGDSSAITALDINVGATNQLSVYGTLIAGGSDETVTGKATYSIISGSDVVSLSSSGLLTALKKGTATVSAAYDDQTINLNITVNRSLTQIFFRINNMDTTSITKYTDDDAVTFTIIGLSSTNGAEIDVTDDTTLSITSGPSVISLVNTTISYLKAGTAVIHAVDGELTADMTVNLSVRPTDNNGNDNNSPVSNYTSAVGSTIVQEATGNLPVAEVESTSVDSKASTVKFDNNTISFIIPENAFGQKVELKVEKLALTNVGEDQVITLLNNQVIKLTESAFTYTLKSVGDVYNFTSDVKFTKPITVQIKYDKIKVKNIKNIGIYTYNLVTKAWDYVGGKIDVSTGTISTNLNHFSMYTVMEYDKSFNDIKTHWAKDAIEEMAARHIASGVGDNFEPNRNVTRAEFATLLVKSLDLSLDESTMTFTDVISKEWYYSYVNAAAKAGLVSGYNGRFNPNNNITREEMAVMMAKAYEFKKGTVTSTLNLTFTDKDDISSWAINSVKISNLKGIIHGYPDSSFKPLNSATRAEGIVMIRNLLSLID